MTPQTFNITVLEAHDESCGCSDCIRALLDELDHHADYQAGVI